MMPKPGKSLVPALFLHIQKTAGSSIIQMAAECYGNANVSSHGDFVGRKPQEFDNVDFVSGHFGFNFAKQLMSGRYSFVFLRDPVERILSFYYFCRTRDPMEIPIYRIAHELEIEDFLLETTKNEIVRRRLWNSQVWRIASGPGPGAGDVDDVPPDEMIKQALEHLDTFSHVGFTETLKEDFSVIMRDLNFPPNKILSKHNVTIGRPTADDHPISTISLIENITQLDRILYDTAWRKRQSLQNNLDE